MMFQKKKFPFNYIHEHRLQVLELPYVKEELSMLILLPEETQDGSDSLLKVCEMCTDVIQSRVTCSETEYLCLTAGARVNLGQAAGMDQQEQNGRPHRHLGSLAQVQTGR